MCKLCKAIYIFILNIFYHQYYNSTYTLFQWVKSTTLELLYISCAIFIEIFQQPEVTEHYLCQFIDNMFTYELILNVIFVFDKTWYKITRVWLYSFTLFDL
jgi:hypothetical protein